MRTMEILSAVTSGGGGGEAGPAVEAIKLAPFVKTVAAEQQLLNTLQIILSKQVPIPYHSGNAGSVPCLSNHVCFQNFFPF
jgi:hypothetical protein